MFAAYFQVPKRLNTYIVPSLFNDRVQNCNCYLSVSSLTCKNISGSLFVVYLSLNMFLLTFFGILRWKHINHTDVVTVLTLNPVSTHLFICLLLLKRYYFRFRMSFGHHNFDWMFFLTFKRVIMLGSTFFFVFLPVNRLVLLFFAV